VFDEHGDFSRRCNKEMVELTRLEDEEDIETLKDMIFGTRIYRHVRATEVLLAWMNGCRDLCASSRTTIAACAQHKGK